MNFGQGFFMKTMMTLTVIYINGDSGLTCLCHLGQQDRYINDPIYVTLPKETKVGRAGITLLQYR